MPTNLRTRFYHALAEQLEPLGFRHVRPLGLFIRPITKEILGWLGMNTSGGRKLIHVNPVVGLRDELVEGKLSELCQEKQGKFHPPTVSTPLCYLMSEHRYRTWDFAAENDIRQVLEELILAIRKTGLQWMTSHGSRIGILQLMEEPAGTWPHSSAFRIPVTYLLLGDKSAAMAFVRSKLASPPADYDVDRDQYAAFADRLFKEAA